LFPIADPLTGSVASLRQPGDFRGHSRQYNRRILDDFSRRGVSLGTQLRRFDQRASDEIHYV
jgi:hypothetical protein